MTGRSKPRQAAQPLRILGGKRRGLHLSSPPGETTRPTSARAREALFNILCHGTYGDRLRGGRFADMFAGSGAVGLEALSRGARHCLFIENDRAAFAVLGQNARRCAVGDEACLVQADGFRPPAAGAPFDFVFIDPPYRPGAVEAALIAARDAGYLNTDSIAILQLDPKTPVDMPAGFDVIDDRRYGAARFLFARPV